MKFPIEIALRKKWLPFLAAAAVLVAGLIVGWCKGLYWHEGELVETKLLLTMIYASPVLALGIWKMKLHGFALRLARALFLPCSALLCLWLWEIMGGRSLFRLDGVMFAVNYGLMLLLFLPFYAIFGDVRRSVPIAFCAITAAAYIYHCVALFRGTVLEPTDLTAFRTALAVADSYTYPVEPIHYLAVTLCIVITAFSRMLPRRRGAFWLYLLRQAGAAGVLAASLYTMIAYPVLSELGISKSQWPADIPGIIENCGTLGQFSARLYGLRDPKPDNYDAQRLANVMKSAKAPQSRVNETLESKPNIIAIMNESFTDMADALGVKMDVDPIPFVHSLSENAIKGDLFVSIRGGGTSNTEYEFLTGNALYANSSIMPFYQVIKSPMPSLMYLLKDQGYTTIAMHPETGANYNRTQVYEHLGFDTFLDKTAFHETEFFRQAFEYVDDRSCYERIKTLYEEKEQDERLFIFNVTMQNHSPYTEGSTKPTVNVTPGLENESQLNEYLRCVQESDRAFGELVSYFSAQEEPTIILFFGDHQPGLTYEGEKAPMAEKSEAKEKLDHYVTPYVIWANYDIEEMQGLEISANYLYSLLLSCTNVEMSAFEAFQLEMMTRYPIITRFGYADAEGHYEGFDRFPVFPDGLKDIYGVTYNRAYDAKNRLSEVYGAYDVVPEK